MQTATGSTHRHSTSDAAPAVGLISGTAPVLTTYVLHLACIPDQQRPSYAAACGAGASVAPLPRTFAYHTTLPSAAAGSAFPLRAPTRPVGPPGAAAGAAAPPSPLTRPAALPTAATAAPRSNAPAKVTTGPGATGSGPANRLVSPALSSACAVSPTSTHSPGTAGSDVLAGAHAAGSPFCSPATASHLGKPRLCCLSRPSAGGFPNTHSGSVGCMLMPSCCPLRCVLYQLLGSAVTHSPAALPHFPPLCPSPAGSPAEEGRVQCWHGWRQAPRHQQHLPADTRPACALLRGQAALQQRWRGGSWRQRSAPAAGVHAAWGARSFALHVHVVSSNNQSAGCMHGPAALVRCQSLSASLRALASS